MSKKYTFYESKAGGKSTKVEKTEEQLTERDRMLLLGTFVNEYHNLPNSVQNAFIQHLITGYKHELESTNRINQS